VFRSLAALVGSGVPLERSVEATVRLAHGPLRALLGGVTAALRDGRSLSQALDTIHGTVPPSVLGMLRAGERAGRLAGTLEQVAVHLEREAELVGRIRHALAYPALLLLAGLGSVVVIGTVVVPKFAALLDEAGQSLPPATRMLLAVSDLLTRHWALLVCAAAMIVWASIAWLRHPQGRHQCHRLLLTIPLVGDVRHGLATARACRALAGSLESGMPLLLALDAAGDAAGDGEIGVRVCRAREQVAAGSSLARALEEQRVLTAGPLQVLAVGEQSGRLADMAGRAGELAARDAERSMSTAVGMLEPALVILLGGFVTFVAAALLQAIYTLRPGAV
jgi:type II secretory pathway component PulF